MYRNELIGGCIIATEAGLLAEAKNVAGGIDGEGEFVFTDTRAAVLVIKIMGKAACRFGITWNAFDGGDPDITLAVFAEFLDYVAADAAVIVFAAVIEDVKTGAIVEVQSVPGTDPKEIGAVGEKEIDGTVGEAAAVIVLLKGKRFGITGHSTDTCAGQGKR